MATLSSDALDAIKAHNKQLTYSYLIEECTVSKHGARIVWDNNDGDHLTVASSTYNEVQTANPDQAFLRNALPVLQASSALVAEVELLRGVIAEALNWAEATDTPDDDGETLTNVVNILLKADTLEQYRKGVVSGSLYSPRMILLEDDK